MAENTIVNLAGEIENAPKTPIVDLGRNNGGTVGPNLTFEESFDQLSTAKPGAIASIPLNSFYIGDRYASSRPGENTEEAYAQQQSAASKFGNALIKTAGTFSSSFLGGTAGLIYGAGKWALGGKLTDIVDNEVNRASDQLNKALDDKFANYYTEAEQNSEWWSGTNLISANFWGDKVLKNFGFAAGAIAGGMAWAKVLRVIGLTNKLVEAGKGFEAATAIEKTMAVVPNTQKYAAFSETMGGLAQKYLKNPIGKVLTNAERSVISITGSAGEGSIEAYQNMNSFRQKAIANYVDTFGKQPEGQDLQDINDNTDKVANYTLGANMLLLSISNFIQLPKILGASRKAEKAMMNDVSQKALGQVWTEELSTGFRKGFGRTSSFMGLGFSPSEAIEEAGQFAIQVGVDEFFNKSNRNKKDAQSILSTFYDVMGETYGKGIDQLLNTKEGMESMIIGGLSGGLQQARQEIKDRGVFGEGGVRKANTQIALEALNATNIHEVLTTQAKYLAIAAGSQKARQNFIKNNDILNEKDSAFDYIMAYVMPRVQFGKEASVQQELDQYKAQAMTDGGFDELVNMGYTKVGESKEQFLDRLGNMKDLAKSVNSHNEAINDKYGDVVTVDGKQKYSKSVLQKLVYSAAKIDNYSKRIPQVSDSLHSNSIAIHDILTGIIESGETNKNATKEALAQIKKLDVPPETKVDLKTDLSDAIELSLRRKIFIDEYTSIKKNPEKFDYEESDADSIETEEDAARVRQPFVNEEGKTSYKVKELEVGKEYSLKQGFLREGNKLALAPKLKVLSTNLGGEYEVQLPTGEITYMTPFQFKKYELTNVDNTSEKVANILDDVISSIGKKAKYKALNINAAGNKLDFVNSLNNQELSDEIETAFNEKFAKYASDLAKSQAKKEKLMDAAGELGGDQAEFENASGEFSTGNDPDEEIDPTKKRKPTEVLFSSTTLPSADSKDVEEKNLPAFVIRYNTFINKVRTLPNRANIKSILVTFKNLADYNLTGLMEIAYEKKSGEKLNEDELKKATSISHGFVASIYVEQDGSDLYYVDANGTRIGSIKSGVDLSKIVFATMPSTDLTWQDGKTARYRVGELEEAKRQQSGWLDFRNTLLTTPDDGSVVAYSFGISNGFPLKIAGKVQKNSVGDVLQLTDAEIAKTKGIVKVSTTGEITHSDGQNYKFAKGRPVLSFGDVLQYLQNSRFSTSQAKTIFEVLNEFSKLVKSDIDANRKIQLKNQYTQFLQNVLFWKKSDSPKANQIFLDEATGKIHIGKNSYNLIDIQEHETEIINNLQQVSSSANSSTLASDDKFYEFYYQGGELKEREWKNYQAYLLSSKNPDGSIRETPLTLDVSVPTASVPYAFTQKYTYLDLPISIPVNVTPSRVSVISTTPTSTGSTLSYESADVEIAKARLSKLIDARIVDNLYGDMSVGDQGEFETSAGPITFTLNDGSIEIIEDETFDKLINNADTMAKMRVDLGLTPASSEAVPIIPAAPVIPEAPAVPIVGNTSLKGRKNRYSANRKKGKDSGRMMTPEDESVFKAWASKNLPKMPYKYLSNMIKIIGGGQAYGQMVDGFVKIVKGGLKGTEFHEAMEYVWYGSLNNEQRQDLLNEFRAQEGTFLDRESGKEYAYNDPNVNDLIAKERIMDNFADYMVGKLSPKSLTEKVADWFKAILDFFKSLVNKPSLQQSLFDAVNAGKFADVVYSSEENVLANRRVFDIPDNLVFEFVEDIKATFYNAMFGDVAEIFNTSDKSANIIFSNIIEDYKDSGININGVLLTDAQYEDLINAAKESLYADRFKFNEENEFSINEENVNNRNYSADAFTVDFKKSASFGVSVLTNSVVRTDGRKIETSDTIYANTTSSPGIEGQQLVPRNEVYATLMSALHNINDVNEFIAKLYDLANSNTDYIELFSKLGGSMKSRTIDFSKYDNHKMRLFVQFMQQYSKQAPEILVQYLRDGNKYSGAASLSKASQVVENEWINSILVNAGKVGSIVKYDKTNKQYIIPADAVIDVSTNTKQLAFLNSLGIHFDTASYGRLSKDAKVEFATAARQVKTDVTTSKVLQLKKEKGTVERTIGSGLIKLASLYASVNSVNFDSTIYNAEGKPQQLYTDSNAPSVFESAFNSARTLDDLFNKLPHIRDVFSKGSQILKLGGLFFDEGGKRTSAKLLVKTLVGEININKDQGKSIADLNMGTRYIVEINQNINGNYYVLIPADGSTEWMMNLGNVIPFNDVKTGRWENSISQIFNKYFIDDITLARDSSNRSTLININGKQKSLRFFEGFLTQPNSSNSKEYTELLNETKKLIDKDLVSPEEIELFAKENAEVIGKATVEFITNLSEKTIKELTITKDIINLGDDHYSFSGLDNTFANKVGVKLNKEKLNLSELKSVINFTNANYVINNIEYFKILFGDPLQFAVTTKGNKTILDITKRIKSFLSPRKKTINFDALNNHYTKTRNEVDGIALEEGELGYHEYKNYARTITASNVIIATKFYAILGIDNTDEADAASWINPNTYREVLDKNGQWSDQANDFHNWQMAYARQNIAKYVYKNEALRASDAKLISTPRPKHVIHVLKPIVTGAKIDKSYIDLALDKFSQLPLYYEAVKETNLEKLFIKMLDEKIDYVVVNSGRKVGAEKLHDLYLPSGDFNDTAFGETVNVPWSAYGIQVENSYDAPKGQTLGSQPTKIITLDLYKNGEPISEEAKEAVEEHTKSLEALYRNGVDNLMYELGIIDVGNRFAIEDKSIVATTLRKEMLKQVMSNNALSSITINEDTNEFEIPFEASTNYREIKQIIYSMVNKRITSPTVNGNSSVQVPVTMWETISKGRSLIRKVGDSWETIIKEDYEKLSDEDKANVMLSDDTLKMYENAEGLRYCEIKIPFPKHLKGLFKNKTDAQILSYLNKNVEKALFGIGFRIPNQALNSNERFKIAGFLPEFMGSMVVVPSAITTKAGSDFDIDKLNMYFKSLYLDTDGEVRLYESKGSEEQTKEFYGEVFDRLIKNDQEAIINQLLEDGEYIDVDEDQKLNNRLDGLEKKKATRDDFVRKAYRKVLENNYFSAIDKILGMEVNFNRLTAANTNKNLMEIADMLDELRGEDESTIQNRILDRTYLTKLRHAFLLGKAWIGILAVHNTSHSNAQKAGLFVDDEDFNMSLPHNKIGKYVSLGGITDSAGRYISDNLSELINAIVDIAKDPYIIKLIYSGQLTSLLMFMTRSGITPKHMGLFLGQPIIRQFVETADNNGKNLNSLIVNKQTILDLLDDYGTTVTAKQSVGNKFTTSLLEENIKSYNNGGELSDNQLAEQQLILMEFIQMFKAANGLSDVVQATTYDTASFKSAEELSRMQLKTSTQMSKEDDVVIKISSAKKILTTTHLGVLENTLVKVNSALSTLFKFNSFDFREFLDDMLKEYGGNKYLSKIKYNTVSEKLSASLLDYIIQSNKDFFVQKLTSGPTSVLVKYEAALTKFPSLPILKFLKVVPAARQGGPGTIKLATSRLDAAEINAYTDMMRGLRDSPETNDLYNDLVNLSIVQGSYTTSSSIKKIIPIEDYAAIVSDLVNTTTNVNENVKSFKRNAMFQRNNFNDVTITPRVELLGFISKKDSDVAIDSDGEVINKFYFASKLNNSAGISIIKLSPKAGGAGAEVITVSRIQNINGISVDYQDNTTITPVQFAKAAQSDDNVFKYLYGYQLVRNPDTGEPMMYPDGKYGLQYLYKLVNLYGDGRFITEYPGAPVPTTLKNGTVGISTEYTDQEVIDILQAKPIEQPKAPVAQVPTDPALIAQPAVIPEKRTEIENKLRILETKVINEGADTDTKEAIDLYRKELGLTPVYELTNANFDSQSVVKESGGVTYGGKSFIIEEDGEENQRVFFSKANGTKGAELASNTPLYNKVITAKDAQDRPSDIVELTELQSSPKYLVSMAGEIISLNDTSYGKQIVSDAIISRVMAKLQYKEKIAINSLTAEDIKVDVPVATPEINNQIKSGNIFSYKGNTINTEFELTKGQDEALKKLADFTNDGKAQFITLQGAAGTGKTSVIGYLQNYLGTRHNFIYMAPTHAATTVLALSTAKTGNMTLPMTVASAINANSQSGVAKPTKKLMRKLGLRNNIMVIDEASMLNSKTYEALKTIVYDNPSIKIIFMGDISQLPEVTNNNPAKKQVSKVFSEFEQVKLTEVKRTNDDTILKVIAVIKNNTNNQIAKVPNTDRLQYLKANEFNQKLGDAVEQEPEDTMLIAFSNKTVSDYNKKIRNELGRIGDLQENDVIVGYLGYSSKQIEIRGDIANSVQYTVKSVTKDGSTYKIVATSKKLNVLRDLGVFGISDVHTTAYYQLSPSDAFTFSDITVSDMEVNNKNISGMLKNIFTLKDRAIKSGKPMDWVSFYTRLEQVASDMGKVDLGADYVYNPNTNRMEQFDKFNDLHKQIKNSYSELVVEKGIDFGHAVTVHKAQGATYKNAFFDANSLPKGSSSELYNGNERVGSEKHSLIYVGMSRASDNLYVSDDMPENFYNLEDYDSSNPTVAASVRETPLRYMVLADQNIYESSEVTIELLKKLGYTDPSVMGKLIEQANGC